MPIGDTMTQPIPAVGSSGTTYASQIVAFLTEVKARLEAKVALTSLLAGLFDLSNNAIANVKYLGLYEQTSAPTTPVGSLQRYQNNLYYVGASGAIRITNGTTIDATGIGGIGGDYAAPAGFWYDLANLEYFAYSDTTTTPKKWARVGAQGFDVYGTLQSTTRVRLGWAGGSSYSLTLPTAVPTRTAPVTMSSSGQLVADDTTHSLHIAGFQAMQTTATHTVVRQGYLIAASNVILYFPITLKDGDQIIGFKLYCRKTTANTDTITAQLSKIDDSSLTITDLGSGASNSANNPGFIVLQETLATPETVSAGSTQYQLKFTPGGASVANHAVMHLELLYKCGS